MARVDCLIVGYNDGDFDQYRLMCQRAGPGTPDWQIFSKEHVLFDGAPRPWIEAFSLARNRAAGRSDRYHPGEVYNLASLYLASYLRNRGLSAETVTLFSAERNRMVELLEVGPRVVAITTTFYVNVLPVLPVVELIRQLSPQSHIVVGGPLIDNLCQDGVVGGAVGEGLADLLSVMDADSYVRESQGEWTLWQLCAALAADRPLTDVPNLILETPDGWQLTRRRPEANDLDECSIDWSRFDAAEIGPTAQLRTARSCAFKCSFCDYPQRAGALTTASVETVRRELRQLAEFGVRNIVFVDDTFNVPPKRFKQLCQMMVEEDLAMSWYSYFRCSNARDDETFDLAAASGCAGVFLGVESADPDVLSNMRKLAQDDQYRTGIARFKERGIHTFASIILGFPGETRASVRRTVDFLNETQPTFWRVQAWWANPRSPVYQQRDVFGIEGSAYDWSHRTMNSREAAELCDTMFADVTESTWLPLYDFDFWSVPYLAGKGVTVPELVPLLRITRDMAAERDRADSYRLPELEQDFAKAVAALDVAPARFSFDQRPAGRD